MKKTMLALLLLMLISVTAAAEIDLPDNLIVIKEGAFAGNISLEGELVIPDGVKSIGKNAFLNCTGITEVTIPEGVTAIGEAAFSGCDSITQVNIPDSVTLIGERAFSGCTNLKTVVTSDGREIADNAFDGCPEVSVLPPVNVKPEYSPVEDFEYEVSGAGVVVTRYIGGDATVVIPETIEDLPVIRIGGSAFSYNYNLVTIYLPSSVHTIDGYAFSGCSQLKMVLGAENVLYFGEMAFNACSSLTYISVSDRVRMLGMRAFGETKVSFSLMLSTSCTIDPYAFDASRAYALSFSKNGNEATVENSYISEYIHSISIPDTFEGASVTAIAENAFEYTANLETVHLPKTIRTIGAGAFDCCWNLKTVTGAENVQHFAERAFRTCNQLSSISINPDYQRFSEYSFAYCSLIDGTFVSEMTGGIPQNAFEGTAVTIFYFEKNGNEAKLVHIMTSDENVVVPDSFKGAPVTSVQLVSPFDVRTVRKLTLPKSLLRIENVAFQGMDEICGIVIPDCVTYIGNEAFSGCQKLTDIVLPKNLKYLGEFAFFDSGITSVNIPSGITELSPYCFCRTNLTSLTIPKNITKIGQAALSETKLTSIVIPEWVTEIGDYLFTECKSLTNVTLPSNMTYLPTCAFVNCTSLTHIDLPDSIESFGMAVFEGCVNLDYVELPKNLMHVPACAFNNTGVRTKAIERVLSECIRSGMSDFEKALALHDWLIKHADYSEKISFFGAEGVLVYGEGVCQSYTDAYAMLLSKVGIAHNVAVSMEMNHTWNLIYLDGEWYHVDCTWDDPIGGREQHKYFGLSDKLMRKDHTWDNPESLPEANGTRYQYGVDNGAPAPTPTPAPTPMPTPAPKPTPVPAPDLPVSPIAEFEYEIAGGEVTIIRYLGDASTVEVPETIGGYPVTVIGQNAFSTKRNLSVVTLPKSVHTIERYAFFACTNLRAVYGAENVIRYCHSAFEDCTSLSYIYISDDIVQLDYGVFLECPLPEMVICLPADSKITESYNFGRSLKLYFFSVKDGQAALTHAVNGMVEPWHAYVPRFYGNVPVTSIAPETLRGDWMLTGLTMHSGIRVIGENAFRECENLETTVYTGGRTIWAGAFSGCPNVNFTRDFEPER